MKLRPSVNQVSFHWSNTIWIVLVHLIAFIFCVPFFSWKGLFLFVLVQYAIGMVGITFGFHRLLTHRAFVAKPWVKNLASFLGTLACQGGPVSWVGQHRVHHAYSDRLEDPHNSQRGFWYSHMGFIFMRRQDLHKFDEVSHYCPDVASSPFFCFLDLYMIPLQFLFGFSLFFLGALVFGAQSGFDVFMGTSFVVWGIFVRLVYGYHITWFVNSATHKWGSKPNDSKDQSRNNWWVGLLAYGEGWHNNHHAEPRSARHGWRWWQLDQTWIFIRILKKIKLVDKLVLPKSFVKKRQLSLNGTE